MPAERMRRANARRTVSSSSTTYTVVAVSGRSWRGSSDMALVTYLSGLVSVQWG
jgi:hypothetical protein